MDLNTITFALFMIGFLWAFVCGIWGLIVAFQVDVTWGLMSTFIPFAGLFFVVKFWDKAKRPFLYQLIGVAMMAVGWVVSEVARI
jgi:hypothetical protein